MHRPAGATQKSKGEQLAQVGIKELLEAGVHFGHQTRRWNPKMRRYIFGERAGIHIIDLEKTEALLHKAQEFAADLAGRGGTILFVGTKKQARDSIAEAAERTGMPYVNQRWLGGLLTNFQTISKRIKRLHDLNDWTENGTLELLPTRERIAAVKERGKLLMTVGGVGNMQRVPDAMFVVDLKTEEIAVREAVRLKIPVIGLVDTNCDPDPVSYVVPGNDDAIRACKVITDSIADVVAERAARFRAEEEQARREAAEKAEREAAEVEARRQVEEAARLEAEEASAAAAVEREQAAAERERQQAEAQQRAAAEQPPPAAPEAEAAPAEDAPAPEPSESAPQSQG